MNDQQQESNHTFSFSVLEEREAVKEQLTVQLSKIKEKAISSEELDARRTILARNKELAKLHRELVIEGVVPEEDFWSGRKMLLIQHQFSTSQKKGTASSLLADIRPTSTDGSEMKLTLTPDIIHSIFVQYPAVHHAFKESVPEKVSEMEFWKSYFSSLFFHRQRGNVSGKKATEMDAILEKYSERDNETLNVHNKSLDLDATHQDRLQGFGNQQDFTMQPGKYKASLPLIRRFNRHSEIILLNSGSIRKQKTVDEVLLDDLNDEPGETHVNLPKAIDLNRYYQKETVQEESVHVSKDLNGSNIDTQSATHVMKQLTAICKKRKQEELSKPYNIDQDILSEVKTMASNMNELLRHFYANFLNPSEEKNLKCQKIMTAIEDIEQKAQRLEALSTETVKLLLGCQGSIQQAKRLFKK